MRGIAITGAGGPIGWHCQAWLSVQPDTGVVPVPRAAWTDAAELARSISGCDAVVHLAGMNRGDDAAVLETNIGLARGLADALDRLGTKPHLLYASSTQNTHETAYGRSKRQAGDVLADWAAKAGAPYSDLVLPNVFGEGGRPYHNSVVATFCHRLAGGETPQIVVDNEIEFLHAHQVARGIGDIIATGTTGTWRPEGRRLRVTALRARLETMDAVYRSNVIPDLRDPFDLDLFNTYRSFLYPDHYPVELHRHTDRRGTLVEAIREQNGGQIHYSNTHPGFVRGEHFHFRKVERFVVLSGEAQVAVRRVCGGEVRRFRLSGDRPAYIDMPTLHTHNLRNVGSGDLVAMFWTHDLYDPLAPDTYPLPVETMAAGAPARHAVR